MPDRLACLSAPGCARVRGVDQDPLPIFQDETDGDRAELDAREAWWASEQTCPACGVTEPTGHMLTHNHGIGPGGTISGWAPADHPVLHGCVAQHLVRNHIAFFHSHDEPFPPGLRTRAERLGLDVNTITRELDAAHTTKEST